MNMRTQHISRPYTMRIIERVAQGSLTWEQVARSCMEYMSERDVQDMGESEDFISSDDDEDDETADDEDDGEDDGEDDESFILTPRDKQTYAPDPSEIGESCKASDRFVMTGEQRKPKKGEWYLSGAIAEAYCAPNNLSTVYHILVKA